MSLTMEEIKERILMFYDPDDLLEALEISAEQLLDGLKTSSSTD